MNQELTSDDGEGVGEIGRREVGGGENGICVCLDKFMLVRNAEVTEKKDGVTDFSYEYSIRIPGDWIINIILCTNN